MNYQILRIRLLLATPLSIAVAIGCIGCTAEGVDDEAGISFTLTDEVHFRSDGGGAAVGWPKTCGQLIG